MARAKATKTEAPAEGRRKPGPAPREVPWTVTSVRLAPEEWEWLRRQAFEESMESGTRPDASAIIRRLVAAAMARDAKAGKAGR